MPNSLGLVPLTIVRIIVACFFSIGFVSYYQRYWIDTFTNQKLSPRTQMWRRGYLLVLPILLSGTIYLATTLTLAGEAAVIYYNWSLFVLVVPFFYQKFGRVELGIQLLAFVLLWYVRHATNFTTFPVLGGLVAACGILAVLKNLQRFGGYYWFVSCLCSLGMALLFWLTVPVHALGAHTTPQMIQEGIFMFTVMLVFVLLYWERLARVDINNYHMQQIVSYDQMTSSDTLETYQHELTDFFTQARAEKRALTLVSLDIDHFKQVNEQFGHLAGNAVLIGVAATIDDTLQKFDVEQKMYRTGGEEFNIVFPGRTPAQVLPIIRECWQAVRKREYSYAQRQIAVTMSAGMTAIAPTDISIDDAYKRADDSLYKSKRTGRDIISVNQEVIAIDQTTLVRDAAKFSFFAQGIYDISQPGNPRFYNELLLRTYDSIQQRWILPDDFEISAHLQTILLRRVLENSDLRNLNMNLTAAQFADRDVAAVLTSFAASADGPDNMTVEITDILDLETTRRISAIYRSAGVKILIDDVGSDNSFELVHSALRYVNGVKFAMQNLRKTNNPEQMRERIQFWVNVARDNQMSFVLEGVENDADLAMAHELGVAYVQGYKFGKPAAVE